jgi:ribosome-binding factor A
MTQRTDRIDQLLREEIGAILAKDVQDPRIGFVTVTDVETAPDLSNARVWVSVIGQPEERTVALRALQRAMPFVRHELGSRVRLRRIPELLLREDESAQRGTRVLRLLAELEAGGAPVDEPPADESLPTPVARIRHEDEAVDEPLTTPPAGRRKRGKTNDRRGGSGGPGGRSGRSGTGGAGRPGARGDRDKRR